MKMKQDSGTGEIRLVAQPSPGVSKVDFCQLAEEAGKKGRKENEDEEGWAEHSVRPKPRTVSLAKLRKAKKNGKTLVLG